MKFILVGIMAVPVIVVLHMAFPGEMKWYQTFSVGAVGGMLSYKYLYG